MDLSKIAGSLLSSDSLKGLSNLTGADTKDITSVLTSTLPSLLSGAAEQAKDNNTAEGFVKPLLSTPRMTLITLLIFLVR